MSKSVIKTGEAPAPIGPYNQAIAAGGFVFVSGQVALDPITGNLRTETLEEETNQVMQNLAAVLKEAGCDFSHVVKTTIFLSDMGYFATVNEIYGRYFTSDFPARETVAVKTLPKLANVEISVIAFKG
jgi:2-iminobutanoate/2-iminopropanoate deaminase